MSFSDRLRVSSGRGEGILVLKANFKLWRSYIAGAFSIVAIVSLKRLQSLSL